jgi:hypothetical protein
MAHDALTGGCLCGTIRYILNGVPRVHFCHCGMCRKATGSAFAVLAWAAASDLRWDGKARPVLRRSSPIASRGFCAICGSPMTLAYDDRPLKIALHVGTLDRPEAVTPRSHYGVESRLAWADCGAGLPEGETEESW